MKQNLCIDDYSDEINLLDEFIPSSTKECDKEQIVDLLLSELNNKIDPKLSYFEKRCLLRGTLNTLPPNTLAQDSINKLDQLLQQELREKSIIDSAGFLIKNCASVGNTKIYVWQGDITTLQIDSIVNAANNQLLGCFIPLHACIDNAIHSAAGVRLRDDCNIIMQKQGFSEPTGVAKITRAYNLPAKFVLHTVGPIVRQQVSSENKRDLAKAYFNCLELCRQVDSIRSIAFCGISTGVFGYPVEQAVLVAVETVAGWVREQPEALDLVVFNVFSDSDKKTYDKVMNSYDFESDNT